MAILNASDKQRIEAAITEAETKTAAEIVVATVARSDGYLDVRLVTALLFGFGASAALHLLLPLVGPGELFAVQIGLGLLAFFVSGLPAVLRWLVPEARKRAAVGRAAQLSFLEHAVFATRERTGVLILLSELEHNVTILGDEGIHARVAGEGWQQHVATIVTAIRSGRAAEGVCAVIAALTQVFAEIAPIRADDTNELDNRVREQR
jgi:putative membrane protein